MAVVIKCHVKQFLKHLKKIFKEINILQYLKKSAELLPHPFSMLFFLLEATITTTKTEELTEPATKVSPKVLESVEVVSRHLVPFPSVHVLSGNLWFKSPAPKFHLPDTESLIFSLLLGI